MVPHHHRSGLGGRLRRGAMQKCKQNVVETDSHMQNLYINPTQDPQHPYGILAPSSTTPAIFPIEDWNIPDENRPFPRLNLHLATKPYQTEHKSSRGHFANLTLAVYAAKASWSTSPTTNCTERKLQLDEKHITLIDSPHPEVAPTFPNPPTSGPL